MVSILGGLKITNRPDQDSDTNAVVQPDNLPARFNFELFKILQEEEPVIFNPKIVYDGRKNAFSPRRLPLGETDSRRFGVSLPQANGGNNPTRPPKVYHILLTKVAEIGTTLLQGFVNGQQSHSEEILTAITALNVVIRMQPNLDHPFDKRSFFTSQDRRVILGGLELWRGIFQSVRPTLSGLVINIDLSTGVMYREGANANPQRLSPNAGLADARIRDLERFINGMRVLVETTGNRPRVVRGLSRQSANVLTFKLHNGTQTTVSQYFQSLNMPLRYPTVICVQVGTNAMIPLEKCTVPRGQIVRKTLSPDQVQEVLAFSTKRPTERLDSIRAGHHNLQYGQSNYVTQFGMHIAADPLEVDARILDAPRLKYGSTGVQKSLVPKDGAWNMLDKKFFEPAHIKCWVIMVYASERAFNNNARNDMVKGFTSACRNVGIMFEKPDPLVKYFPPQGDKKEQMKAVGNECNQQFQSFPSLIVAILPDGGGDIYHHIKHFGDALIGVPTQCLKFSKCTRAKEQYWMNVVLKVNVKLGGINVIPDTSTVTALTDPQNPTIVMGADVIHPPPGVKDRPSFPAVVGNVDTNAAKYVAITALQDGRVELIEDLQAMCKRILKLYMTYREQKEKKAKNMCAPKRLVFFRDGVSEGEFQQVLDKELPRIKACQELGINPKITLVVVRKRHHNQFFPPTGATFADRRSGNCPAGTVVDQGIAHPTEFDFFLLSHAGILGTSRPAHYSVLYDESGFNADSMQSFSYTLCHVYARSTRSVSIPAPVYYADIVCYRARNHFDPADRDFSDTSTVASGAAGSTTHYLETFKQKFKPPHPNQERMMYFM
ncbi:hypothetical protein NLJ89_g5086 [Agrocybe chaxingu]|uniref:Uncharacterized protein n=1 Tax=Agrocybe chaxingu TaxID=84603 RepID=A0A9W8K1Y0_9AGAR|nr:hypothetical protein NLJ89_g5086 [Agrocybe chaxingu]